MRLLYVVDRYWPSVGGIQLYAHNVARAQAARHEVTVLACAAGDGPSPRTVGAVPVEPAFEPFSDGPVVVRPLSLTRAQRFRVAPVVAHRAPGIRRYAYGRSRLAIARLFARAVAPTLIEAGQGADLVHMWGGDLLGAAAVRAARRLGVPVVMTPFAHRGQWGDDVASGAVYRSADRVVALLHADAAVYEGLGVAAERIDVVPVCSPGVASGRGSALRARLGIDGPLVLYLGVRRPYKGYALLREAADVVAAARPDVAFAWVGPGAPVRPSAASPRVIDAGEVSEDERAAWLDAADLLCLPSQGEIFPNVFLEAWSVSTPVLGRDIATLEELVSASGGGIVAPGEPEALARAVVELVGDPERLAALGAAGHAFWRQHASVEAVASRYEHLYRELLAQREAACAA